MICFMSLFGRMVLEKEKVICIQHLQHLQQAASFYTVISFEYTVWLHCQVPHSKTDALGFALLLLVKTVLDLRPPHVQSFVTQTATTRQKASENRSASTESRNIVDSLQDHLPSRSVHSFSQHLIFVGKRQGIGHESVSPIPLLRPSTE